MANYVFSHPNREGIVVAFFGNFYQKSKSIGYHPIKNNDEFREFCERESGAYRPATGLGSNTSNGAIASNRMHLNVSLKKSENNNGKLEFVHIPKTGKNTSNLPVA